MGLVLWGLCCGACLNWGLLFGMLWAFLLWAFFSTVARCGLAPLWGLLHYGLVGLSTVARAVGFLLWGLLAFDCRALLGLLRLRALFGLSIIALWAFDCCALWSIARAGFLL